MRALGVHVENIVRRFAFGTAWVWFAASTAALPAAAVSFSLDAVVLNQSLRAATGGGLIHGSECSTSVGSSSTFGPCHAEYDYNGTFSPAVPVHGESGVSVSTTVGSNTVGADAYGGTTLQEPSQSDLEFYGPGTFLVGRMQAVVNLRDSQPDQYHTSADASMAVHDWFDITVPTDQQLFFKLEVLASGSRLTTDQDQRFVITSLANNQVLFERSQNAYTFEEFDLSAWAGQQLRFEFEASVAEHGDAGFGNGATNFLNLSTLSGGYIAFRQLPVPEPGTMPLLGLGLAALIALRRVSRRSNT
ncbi:MAG: PEP-CTERM sorting domain-containing protein [Deltaproteobacteria bacterium]|nr:MAG: PEP-CTERM sorting domain-containing protein [Deltaproteobacteria bacterium]